MNRTISPLKSNNRLYPGIPKDEITELARQDDNVTWCKGFPLIKEVSGRAGQPSPDTEPKVNILCPRINRVELINK